MILTEITLENFTTLLKGLIADELKKSDRIVSKSELAIIFGVSTRTIDRMMDRGILHRVNDEGPHPRFSLNEAKTKKKFKL